MARGKIAGFWALLFALVFVAGACRAKIKTLNPEEEVRYTAEYGYTDLKVLSTELAGRILKSKVAAEEKPPVMIIYGIENRTDEHIDTKALSYAIRNELIKSGKFMFINEAQRKKIEGEIDYQQQGYISPETRIKVGKQIGAKYIMSGQLVSITQNELKQVRIKKKELRYYRLTLEITDINTNIIVWTDEQEIVRKQAKPFVGW